MTSGELLDLFRVEMADTKRPYLWSDEFVFRAIDDAQVQLARRTEGIPDSTTQEVVKIAVTAAQQIYSLHPKIKKIRSARRADTGRPVEIINFEDMAPRGIYFDGTAGPVRALVIGMDDNSVRTYPLPNETVDVLLSVFRLPLTLIDGDQEFEVAERHHMHLLKWVKHLAYGVQDAETYDKTKSQEFRTDFIAYCAQVFGEQQQARHKTRIVAYGGI